MNTMSHFETHRLRNIRKEACFTQAEMGKLLGVSRETILHIENGKEGSVDALGLHLIRNWYLVCRERLCPLTHNDWSRHIKTFLHISDDHNHHD